MDVWACVCMEWGLREWDGGNRLRREDRFGYSRSKHFPLFLKKSSGVQGSKREVGKYAPTFVEMAGKDVLKRYH